MSTETIRAEAAKDLADLMGKGLAKEEAEAIVVRRVVQRMTEEARKGGAVLQAMRPIMTELVAKLRAAGVDKECVIQIATKGATYKIMRGADKGKQREWRFSQGKGKRGRRRRTPGEKLSAFLNPA